MSSGRKFLYALLLLLIVLLLAAAVVIPRLVDVDRYRPEVISGIEQATGKHASIGHLALTLLPKVALRAEGLALANPPGFPAGDFLTAQRIDIQPDVLALWNRQVVIRALSLDHAVVHLLSDARGRRNFALRATPPARRPIKSVAWTPSSWTLATIGRIQFSRGLLTDGTLLPSGVPAPTSLEVQGLSGEIEQFDWNTLIGAPPPRVAAAGLLPSAWLASGAATSEAAAGKGSLEADSLRFGRLEGTRVRSQLALGPRTVSLRDLRLDCYGGQASGELSFDFSGINTHYRVQAKVADVDMARLLASFPQAQGKMTGRLQGNLDVTGELLHSEDPLAGKRGTGQVTVRNGRLPALRLDQKVMELARLSSLGPVSGDPSSFSSISADLNIDNRRMTSRKVTVLGNGLDIEATGSLTLEGEGSLDYSGTLALHASSSQNLLATILANATGARMKNGKLLLPFRLTGTLASPHFTLKSSLAPQGTPNLPGLFKFPPLRR
jgi:uncharacterized protein involved in outer membrane biogenesis